MAYENYLNIIVNVEYLPFATYIIIMREIVRKYQSVLHPQDKVYKLKVTFGRNKF